MITTVGSTGELLSKMNGFTNLVQKMQDVNKDILKIFVKAANIALKQVSLMSLYSLKATLE